MIILMIILSGTYTRTIMLNAAGLNKSNGGAADLVYILRAKTNQLKKMGCYTEARSLLNRVQNELGGGKSGDRSD